MADTTRDEPDCWAWIEGLIARWALWGALAVVFFVTLAMSAGYFFAQCAPALPG